MSLITLGIINQFGLPLELCNIIKDYLFYDINTIEYAKHLKHKRPYMRSSQFIRIYIRIQRRQMDGYRTPLSSIIREERLHPYLHEFYNRRFRMKEIKYQMSTIERIH
jgi:hypothetical protein